MPAFTGDNIKNRPGNKRFKNKRWEMFCYLYARKPSKHYFGNGTQCHLHAFDKETIIDDLEKEIAMLRSQIMNEDGMTEDGRSAIAVIAEKEAEVKSIKDSSRTAASVLLANDNVRARCDWLLDQLMDETEMDREMVWTIMQREHLPSKVMAFQAIAKVKGRVKPVGEFEGKVEFSWEKEGKAPKGTVTIKRKEAEDDDEVSFASE